MLCNQQQLNELKWHQNAFAVLFTLKCFDSQSKRSFNLWMFWIWLIHQCFSIGVFPVWNWKSLTILSSQHQMINVLQPSDWKHFCCTDDFQVDLWCSNPFQLWFCCLEWFHSSFFPKWNFVSSQFCSHNFLPSAIQQHILAMFDSMLKKCFNADQKKFEHSELTTCNWTCS